VLQITLVPPLPRWDARTGVHSTSGEVEPEETIDMINTKISKALDKEICDFFK